MAGQRVLVSGMGGELGSFVTGLLESEPWVGALQGIDVDPPRRRLRRAQFLHVTADDHSKVVDAVTRFNPHMVIHMAVWEPDARAKPSTAAKLTDGLTTSILGAAADCRALESIIIRSGIEIYGRGRGALTRPDESAPTNPTSEYGRMLAGIEATATDIGTRVGVGIGTIRLAPVIGRHVSSPLGRMLRMPLVPFSALANPPFTVVHVGDAAHAFVTAARRRITVPVNVVAPGSITALQALRHGHRIPVPLLGPEWAIARPLSHLFGAPVPDHVIELLHRGLLADGSRLRDLLQVIPEHSTTEIIGQLYAWPSVIRMPARQAVA